MNIFTYVKSKLTIFDIVNEYATLKKAGLYWKGSCPFHHEKTASFTISPHREIFYCFGCHVGGDVIAFIAQAERCSPLEAAHFLIDRYGLEVPESLSATVAAIKPQQKQRYFDLCELVAHWLSQNLNKFVEAQEYCQYRSLSAESIKHFMLGYFPEGSTSIKSLIQWCQHRGFLAQDLLEAHILVEGKSLYSPFEGRIIFPIRDSMGRYCGFGGRTFKPNDERPKYYNSHDHELFNKGHVLFGLDQAKKTIQQQDEVFLVEGYIDCIMMAQKGFMNTVATLGTACTADHLKILSRYASTITIVYDGDSAGHKAIMRLAALTWQCDTTLMVIRLPAQEDPASFLMQNKDFKALYASRQDIFSFFIQQLGSTYYHKTLPEKLIAIKTCVETLASIQDPIKQNMLIQQASNCFDVPVAMLAQEITTHQHSRTFSTIQKPISLVNKPDTFTELTQLEKKLFYAILTDQIADKDDQEFLRISLPSPLNTLVQHFNELQVENEAQAFERLFDSLKPDEKVLMSKIVLELEETTLPSADELFKQFAKKQWKMMVNNVKLKLAAAHVKGDPEETQKILNELDKLKSIMLRKGLI